jgi:signal transduction histidine kinase
MGSVKLLNKTFRIYLLYSVIVLAVAAPLFYFSITRLYIEETDETLLLYKKEFQNYYLPHLKQSEIENWNKNNRDIKIKPTFNAVVSDTFFYQDNLDIFEDEKVPYRVFHSQIDIENKPYIYIARKSLVESDDLIENIAIVFCILISLFLIVLTYVTNRISKKIWHPFHNTLEKLKSFDLTSQTDILFEKTKIKEFEELNTSLQKLINNNISVYNQQKTFIENASHELQTPLAVLKSKIDLLLQNKDITNEQIEIINAIELPLSRVSRTNKNLFLLAKIENNQFADKENIEITEIVNETLELLFDYISAKHISVDKLIIEKLIVVCNKSLVEILISNLLVNSINHNIENGKLSIDFSVRTLRISNTGKFPLNTEKLFERFAISYSETTNSGLGLAIVKEICNRYHWQINYSFEDNLHSFAIKF